MTTKVVVHSNFKRLVQVILAALLIAGGLVGIKKLAAWWRVPEAPVAASAPLALEFATPAAQANNLITGRSSVIDADTLEIHGMRIRLEGIDAPESSQRCGAAGQEWACGQQAALALNDWIGERNVSCRRQGQDRYQRTLARCFVGTEDVQSWLVLNGWALAYRRYSADYVAAEEIAQSRQAGLWQGEFVPPWQWRQNGR